MKTESALRAQRESHAGSLRGRPAPVDLAELRARTPLAPLIGRRVPLKRAGGLWSGCCPFHGERTPSFYVYDDHYHCYGCGAHGDAITFIQQADNLSFKEAITLLAGEAGLTLGPNPNTKARHVKRSAAQAKREKATAADLRSRMRKARFIADKAVPIEPGGLAETYLIKTRSIPRPVGDWPATIRWLAPWKNGHGSVVFLATDGVGETRGVQRILVDAEGGNVKDAHDKNIKVSHGVFRDHGAVVRLPGAADGPLLLAEGPETGLSVWVATGIETWISVGGIINHKPPMDRRVVVCRDDDPADSKADKWVIKAVADWRLAGVDCVVATPWAVRRFDRSDFNDAIRESGRDGVLCRIEAALLPPLPSGAHPRVTVEQGRKQTKAAIERFFAAVKDGGHASLAMGIRVEVGIGKSATAREEAAKLLVEMRARHDNRTLVFAVDTHVLGTEAIHQFLALPLVRKHGFTAAQWRGRTAEDPEIAGWTMCTELERVKAAQTAGANVERACCRQELDDGTVLKCAAFDLCGYQRQKCQGHADVWFVAHEALFSAKPAVIDQPALIVIDESFWQAGLEGADGGIELTVETLGLAASLGGLDGQRQRFLRSVALDVLRSHVDGPMTRAAFLAAGLTADAAMEAHALEWRLHSPPDLDPSMTNEAFRAAERASEPNRTARRLARFWKALAALLASDGPERSGWAAVEAVRLRQGDVRMIGMKGRKTIKQGWCAPVLMIDANFRLDLARHFFPDVELIADIAVSAPHQRIIQIDGRSNSKRRLIDDPLASDAENRRRGRHRRENVATLHKIARAYPGKRGLVVAQQAMEQWLSEHADLPDRVDLAHFNRIAGRDVWGPKPDQDGVGFLVVVGRVMPAPGDVEAIAEALSGHAVDRIKGGYPRVQAGRAMASGEAVSVETPQHPDALCEAIRCHICEGEIVQAIGRARGVNRTRDNPVDVYVMTDVALPVPVAILVPATLLDPTPADLMLACGGVAFASSTDAARAYPALWRTPSAAKSAMARAEKSVAFPYVLKKEASAPNIARMEYQQAGQGKRGTVAVFDLSRVPDPRRHLEGLFGELAGVRVLPPDQKTPEIGIEVRPTRGLVHRSPLRDTPARRRAPLWADPPALPDPLAWTPPPWTVLSRGRSCHHRDRDLDGMDRSGC